ncbi:putative zinc-binding oxidoreductase ToxD [Poronia punctata]|nr:putative zinc-binding oxidoreductase ToxD [Poronia punctata]
MQNYGLIREAAGKAALEAIPVPKLEDDYVLVRTVAVALNPTDWTTLDAPGDDGTLVGCDFAGVVEEVGSVVSKGFKKGDRVAGFAHGGNDAKPHTGAFARYIVAKEDLIMRIPDQLSFESASTITVGVASAGYALYKVLGLPFPGEQQVMEGKNKNTLLIYGGSTATGTIAIQLAKLSGWKVITTCSPRHFDMVKSRGADEVFDYRAQGVGKQIREASKDSITKVFDTVNSTETAQICADAFADPSGEDDGKRTYCNLLGEPCPRDDVESVFFLGYSQSGEFYIFEGEKYDARPEDQVFARKWFPLAEKLWAEGRLKTHPEEVGTKGLLGCLDGMDRMRRGQVSGVKLVYCVDDTAWPA